jgi:hypothetical protein
LEFFSLVLPGLERQAAEDKVKADVEGDDGQPQQSGHRPQGPA